MRRMLTSRFIPRGFTLLKETKLAVVYATADGLSAIAYSGKSNKSDWYYKYRTTDQLNKQIFDYFTRLESREKDKKDRREAKKNYVTKLKVGDIMNYSWGYEQTNQEFYQIIEIKGKTAKLMEIGCKSVPNPGGSDMSDRVIAVKDSFVNKEVITKRILPQDYMSMSFGCLSKTDDKEQHYRSWYA